MPYREIFEAIEKTVKEIGDCTEEALDRYRFPSIGEQEENVSGEGASMDARDDGGTATHASRFPGFRRMNDSDFFQILVRTIFYSGFNADTVNAALPAIYGHFPDWHTVAAYTDIEVDEILADPNMISNSLKVQACIRNAIRFGDIVQQFGSFSNYINSFSPNIEFFNLLLLRDAIIDDFDYIGADATSWHFLMDIGFPVCKPDRVVLRLLTRLGLIRNENQFFDAINQVKKMAHATGHSVRYVDKILVAHGQRSTREFGIRRGVCLLTPRCSICYAKKYCHYFIATSAAGPAAASAAR